MSASQENKTEDRARKSLEKKEKKAAAKKRAADSGEGPTASLGSTSPPPSKKSKLERAEGQEDQGQEAKEEKRKRKEEKRAKKAAAKAAAAAGVDSSPEVNASNGANTTLAPPVLATFTPTDPAAAQAYLDANAITIEAPEESDQRPSLPLLSFRELDGKVDSNLSKALDSEGFKNPTPIQACCWPVLLQGNDVVGVAETGSGKTFAFGLPALQHLITKHGVKVKEQKKSKKDGAANINILVIAPTRELAIQTHENLAKLGDSLGVGSICLYGGVSKHDQVNSLKSKSNIRIVVGTPGRVLDLAREGSLDLTKVTFLVLDEADRMLDKGFEPDIRAIIGMCQSREQGRHTSMFSATWPPAVRGLAETFMRGPIRVTVGSDELSANKRVEQVVEVLEDGRAKERRLEAFLRQVGAKNSNDKILVFALYKKEAQRVEGNLRRAGYRVAGIHGDLSQHDRIASLESFKNATTPLLVATDVAARGLDIPNVEHVVNYTFPLTIEDYVHRIGRTGRGGKTGKSLTFFTEEDKSHAGELIRVLKDAGQKVPEPLTRFPTTIKKKTHSSYGDHFKELVPGKAKKIVFD
ncbi:putative DBP3-putative RNA helicase required for pre-rRNA processing [Violaceomyces palustris]|uniref:DBP3-putative RNA helicase required for pre-rRNA processing n=1 Tax=Violaceomyces palustris TaxID=1673888 RepID=A0ACD0NQ63_9BASI|nr:putative DBP3-putative RNA helicase required for pre-rRNA processing [Violaceomyces palustris]